MAPHEQEVLMNFGIKTTPREKCDISGCNGKAVGYDREVTTSMAFMRCDKHSSRQTIPTTSNDKTNEL